MWRGAGNRVGRAEEREKGEEWGLEGGVGKKAGRVKEWEGKTAGGSLSEKKHFLKFLYYTFQHLLYGSYTYTYRIYCQVYKPQSLSVL